MKTVSISFRMKIVDVLSLSFIVPSADLLIKLGKSISFRLNWWMMRFRSLLLNGQTLLAYRGYHYAAFSSVGSRQFEADNIDQVEAVGRYLGQLHQIE